MSGGSCYKPRYESGAWFELKCIRDIIANKEFRGEDSSFEWDLYNSWLTYPEYARADKENRDRGLYTDSVSVTNRREGGLKIRDVENNMPAIMTAKKAYKNTARVDKNKSVATTSKRGRRKQDLPVEIIRKLSAQGMGYKMIAARLFSDYGLVANYRTIGRRLQSLQD